MTKSTPKTTNSKKPVPKARAVKAQSKTAAKKPATKKTSAKTAPKTSARSSANQTAKSTKEDLRSSIASLETRMKRANSLTRKSVKALESVVETLDARTRKDSSTSKAALTRQVNQLAGKLTDMVAKTQAEVNSDLKTALNNPTVDKLQAALSRADRRMSAAETAQASAISKVNRHLSAIAIAVDARIEDEANARKSAIKVMTTRVDTIEADTAQALSSVGNKIAELSGELTQRSETSELSIREKVSEIALQTQTEFERYRAGLDRRLDDVARNSDNSDTYRLEHSIASLTARLEGLEYAVANPPVIEAAPQAIAPSVPQLSIVSSQPLAAAQFNTHQTAQTDAFSPLETPVYQQEAIMPNPYLAGQTSGQATEQAGASSAYETPQEAHIPQEFNPQNYAESVQVPEPSPLAQSPQNTEPMRDFSQTQAAAPAQALAPPPIELGGLPPIAGQAIPYADPAYAETDPTMAGQRIGGEGKAKFALPILTGRNLRVAALATGVAVIGLVAAKGVFGGSDNPAAPTQTVQQTPAQNNVTPVSIPSPETAPRPNTSAAPIGDYADNKPVTVAPSSDAAKSLNSAAAAGDGVAQFQLGLSYLEQGRTDEGVSLIRKSANQNQPAAQYRLAKLYEIGEGVTQDSEMARQLTERAATNGNRIAMHDLALYYAEGRGGVEADLQAAAKWFEKAAERGVVDSQFNLGVLFESGQGLPKNVNDAFVWYSIAAAQGDQFAKTRIEVLTPTLGQADLASAKARVKTFKPVKIDDRANGIFRNVAWNTPKDDAGEKVSQVRQVQTMLSELGYDIGGADGSVGPKTRSAIISFERSNSLPETGRVNTALIDRLELATGA
ncbi:MAG: peptidoglycan-binding protein [Hellea sp.]